MAPPLRCHHCGTTLQPLAEGRTGVSVLHCHQCQACSLRLALHQQDRFTRWLKGWLRSD